MTSGNPSPAESDRAEGEKEVSLKSLFLSIKSDAQELFKSQTELAKTEIGEQKKDVGISSGMFAVTIGAMIMCGIFVLITIAYVLIAFGLPEWAGFGIVALFLLLVAGICGAIGLRAAKKIKGPREAKAEWNKTKAALSSVADGSSDA